MFPSNINGNNDPISYNDQSIFQRTFINDINPNSKQEDPPLSFFHFPSPFIIPYELELELELEDHDIYLPQQQHDLLIHQQPLRADHNMTVINMADSIKNDINGLTKDCNKNTTEQLVPRKRSSKRDRHSKIKTAQGLRDRRMRLSLDVAKDFFHLQDMLGYDKASKTVEWLLIQANPEIKKLARGPPQMNYSSSVGAKSASSTSECEVVSGVDEASIKGSISKGKPSIKEKKTRQSRKSGFHPRSKEKREQARKRARERTREKMWGQKFDESKTYIDARNHDLSQLGSCSPFETGEESGTQSHNMNPSMEVAVADVEEPSSHGTGREHLEIEQDMVEESLVIMGKWSPSTIFNYLPNTGIPQEHQFADFQIFGKPWEVYNNQNLC